MGEFGAEAGTRRHYGPPLPVSPALIEPCEVIDLPKGVIDRRMT